MVKMRTLVKHEYANRMLDAGDEFEAEDGHVTLLIGLGRAEPLDPAERNTRAMESTRATRVINTRNQRRHS